MHLDSILLDVLRSRGQERFKMKPKQKEALEKFVLDGQDCLIVLPTRYGKSLIYFFLQCLTVSLRQSEGQIDCDSVVSPLNALIDDQINKLNTLRVCCASLRLCGEEAGDLKKARFEESFQENLQLSFTHP